jgi:hypothetical protein
LGKSGDSTAIAKSIGDIGNAGRIDPQPRRVLLEHHAGRMIVRSAWAALVAMVFITGVAQIET